MLVAIAEPLESSQVSTSRQPDHCSGWMGVCSKWASWRRLTEVTAQKAGGGVGALSCGLLPFERQGSGGIQSRQQGWPNSRRTRLGVEAQVNQIIIVMAGEHLRTENPVREEGAQAKRPQGGAAVHSLPSKMKGECAERPG